MFASIARQWKYIVVQGVLTLVVGIVFWVWPHATATVLMGILAAFLIIDGAVGFWGAWQARSRGSQVGLALPVILVALGLAVLVWPSASAKVVLVFIGIGAVLIGLLLFFLGLASLRAGIVGWLVMFVGLVITVFGFVAIFNPAKGATSLIWLIGLLAVVTGIAQLGTGLWLRSRLPAAERLDAQFAAAQAAQDPRTIDIAVVDITPTNPADIVRRDPGAPPAG